MNLLFLAKLLGLVVLGWVVVVLIEPLDPSTACAPFLLGIVLMALSLRQSVSLVVAASLIYSGLTMYDLIVFLDYVTIHLHPILHPDFVLFQRMGLFFVVCAMAIYLAYYRVSTQRMLVHVQNILTKLPTPVVISNATGYIIYANEALASIFKQNASQLVGQRYVDVILPDVQESKAMRYYTDLFIDSEDSIHELELKALMNGTKLKARLTCFGVGTSRVLITGVEPMKPNDSVKKLTTRVIVQPQST